MKKKKAPAGSNWMDTYGDMVTLLLCFFVLLYSISSVDQQKLKAVVQSFNPDAVETPTEIIGGYDAPWAEQFDMDEDDEKAKDATEEDLKRWQEEIDGAIDRLYQALKKYADEKNISDIVDVTKGDGYVFVSFNESVFFDGDSYVLKNQGTTVLSAVAEMLSSEHDYIDEVRVMGHTAQARTDRANEVTADRFLASNRATIATVYIQERCGLNPARIVSVGYGQHLPIKPNDTEENKSQNRRVEIVITGFNVANGISDSIEKYYVSRKG